MESEKWKVACGGVTPEPERRPHAKTPRRKEDHTSPVLFAGLVPQSEICFHSLDLTSNRPFRRKAHSWRNEPVRSIPSVSSVSLYVQKAAFEVSSAILNSKVLERAPEPSPATATSPFVSWSQGKTVTEHGPSRSHPLSRTVDGACKPEYKEGKR